MSREERESGRVEVLPVQWRKHLTLEVGHLHSSSTCCPTEWQNGPTEWQNGPTEWQNGPTEWQNGPTEWQNGPAEWQNGPTVWQHDPTE